MSGDLTKLSTITLYRMLIKNMKYYPSKNRFNLLVATKEEFRDSRNLKDEKLIKVEIKKARLGVAHVILYKEKMEELYTKEGIKSDRFRDSLNTKDDDFIYF